MEQHHPVLLKRTCSVNRYPLGDEWLKHLKPLHRAETPFSSRQSTLLVVSTGCLSQYHGKMCLPPYLCPRPSQAPCGNRVHIRGTLWPCLHLKEEADRHWVCSLASSQGQPALLLSVSLLIASAVQISQQLL